MSVLDLWVLGKFWGWFERQGKFTKCVSRRLHHVSRRRYLDICRTMCWCLSGIVDLRPKTRQKFVALSRFNCTTAYFIRTPLFRICTYPPDCYPLQPHATVLYRVIPASNPLSLRHCNVSRVKKSTQVHIHMKRYTTNFSPFEISFVVYWISWHQDLLSTIRNSVKMTSRVKNNRKLKLYM